MKKFLKYRGSSAGIADVIRKKKFYTTAISYILIAMN